VAAHVDVEMVAMQLGGLRSERGGKQRAGCIVRAIAQKSHSHRDTLSVEQRSNSGGVMKKPDVAFPDPGPGTLLHISDSDSQGLIGRYIVVAFGVGMLLYGVLNLDVKWLVAGSLLVAVGGYGILETSGGYPRLHLDKNRLWVQGRWGIEKSLDLSELGPAHVVKYRVGRRGAMGRALAFLHREEETALADAGQPAPSDIDAYYRTVTLSVLVGDDHLRALELAEVINARRPLGDTTVAPKDRVRHLDAISGRSWARKMLLAAGVGLLLLPFAVAVFNDIVF
jgi:hypothetical protein